MMVHFYLLQINLIQIFFFLLIQFFRSFCKIIFLCLFHIFSDFFIVYIALKSEPYWLLFSPAITTVGYMILLTDDGRRSFMKWTPNVKLQHFCRLVICKFVIRKY